MLVKRIEQKQLNAKQTRACQTFSSLHFAAVLHTSTHASLFDVGNRLTAEQRQYIRMTTEMMTATNNGGKNPLLVGFNNSITPIKEQQMETTCTHKCTSTIAQEYKVKQFFL